MKKIKREEIQITENEFDDFTGNGPWEHNNEIYDKIDDYLVEGDGECHATITKRQSDGKFFKFEWCISISDRYYFEEELIEVFPKTVIRYE